MLIDGSHLALDEHVAPGQEPFADVDLQHLDQIFFEPGTVMHVVGLEQLHQGHRRVVPSLAVTVFEPPNDHAGGVVVAVFSQRQNLGGWQVGRLHVGGKGG